MEKPIKAQTDASGRPLTGRPVIYATQGLISSGHYLTSMAGMQMLLAGGNAFDAVVAAGFAAAVIEPIASYSLGAESVFMFYHAASGDLLSLSGQGTAPARATVDFYRDQGLDCIPTGPGSLAHLSFTVPGVVDAYLSLLERYGTLSLARVLEPAIQLAESGFPHYEYMVDALDSDATREQFALYPPGGSKIFYDRGALPRPGTLLLQPGLATILKRLAEHGASGPRLDGIRSARDDFYRGDLARTLVNSAKSVGGILELGDLDGYQARFEDPARTRFLGHEICGQTTWSQAPVLQLTLNLLERFDLKTMGHNSPTYIHTVVEALKLALADREAHFGDPEFAAVPLDGLLSKDYAIRRSRLIDPDRAHPELPPAGDPWVDSRGDRPPAPIPSSSKPGGGTGTPSSREQGTTHIAAIDQEGNLVCATPSGGSFGKSVFFPELGFALSTRIEMFQLGEGHPNVLVPGKRPRTTLVNYLVIKNGSPVMTFGCPGGDHQAQANLQLMLNTLVFGMDPQQAIEVPRFASDAAPNSFHPHEYLPGQLSLEKGFPDSTWQALQALGHRLVPATVCGMGATITRRDPQTGVMATGADPRRSCYALGW